MTLSSSAFDLSILLKHTGHAHLKAASHSQGAPATMAAAFSPALGAPVSWPLEPDSNAAVPEASSFSPPCQARSLLRKNHGTLGSGLESIRV